MTDPTQNTDKPTNHVFYECFPKIYFRSASYGINETFLLEIHCTQRCNHIKERDFFIFNMTFQMLLLVK